MKLNNLYLKHEKFFVFFKIFEKIILNIHNIKSFFMPIII
jgi:hypothetical protein